MGVATGTSGASGVRFDTSASVSGSSAFGGLMTMSITNWLCSLDEGNVGSAFESVSVVINLNSSAMSSMGNKGFTHGWSLVSL